MNARYSLPLASSPPGKPADQPYGDLTELNCTRLVLDAVGKEVLASIAQDLVGLLDTATAVYEKTGDYAMGIFSSSWCRKLDNASRNLCGTDDNRAAMQSGKWLCHDACWQTSKASIDSGQPVDLCCPGSGRIYAVPIWVKGEVAGSINVGYGFDVEDPQKLQEVSQRYGIPVEELKKEATAYRSRPPSVIEAAKKHLETVARLIGAIIERKQAEEIYQAQARQQAFLAKLGQYALTHRHLGGLLNEAVTGVAQVLQVELCKVQELQPDGKTLLLRAGVGWKEGQIGLALVEAGANSQAGFTLMSCEPVVVDDLRTETRFQAPLLLLDHGVVSGLTVTIYHGDRVYGVLGAHNTRRRTFTSDEAQFLQAVANILATAIMRQQMEQALQENEARFLAILDNAPVAIYMVDLQNRFLLVNRHAVNLLGRPSAQIVGQSIFAFFPGDIAARLHETYQTVLRTGQSQEWEEVIPFADGPHTFLSLKFPLFDLGGTVYAICGIATDIAERKKLEEQLRQTQKMDAIGKLAGGVAHDFNNLLTIINGYSELIVSRLPADNPAWGLAREINKSGERAAALTRQLLAFSRKTILQPRVLDLNTLAADLERMLRRLIGEDILLDARLAPALGQVKADPGQLEQVIMNLAVNARDAMPQGGRLTLATSNVDLDEAFTSANPEVAPGPYVLLSVSDTGCGMDEQVLAHLFEPFFTTKELGKGTGLGLAMVYGIIKQSDGHVAVDSQPGQGSTFRIYLPRIQQAARARPSFSETAQPLPGTETLLLVEDEEGVRRLLIMGLTANGYQVLEAHDGQQALELAAQHPGRIDLLITDVVMPRLSGGQLADQLLALRPDLKVLFLSGYTDEAVLRHGVSQGSRPFLQKPFTPSSLARKVREVLDRQ